VSAEKARAKCAKIEAPWLEGTVENIDNSSKSEVRSFWYFINTLLDQEVTFEARPDNSHAIPLWRMPSVMFCPCGQRTLGSFRKKADAIRQGAAARDGQRLLCLIRGKVKSSTTRGRAPRVPDWGD
jgi:hypothetical protein